MVMKLQSESSRGTGPYNHVTARVSTVSGVCLCESGLCVWCVLCVCLCESGVCVVCVVCVSCV